MQVLILLLMTFCLGEGVTAPQCQHVHTYADTVAVLARDNYCYSFINTKKKFYDAKSDCNDVSTLCHL